MNFKERLEKLQNLPDEKKKAVLWTIVTILGLIIGVFWFRSATEGLYKISNEVGQINIPKVETPSAGILGQETNQTADWKTYKNEKYKFEIKYPSDWSLREYISGVAFFPTSESDKNTTGNGSMNVGFYSRGAAYCEIPFEDYVKVAGPSEIQNYESSNTIKEGVTNSGISFYQITWNYTTMKGVKNVSLPITYFGIKDAALCGSIDASLNDTAHSDIYDKMISSFNFVEE